MYAVSTDAEQKLVSITLAGFWTPEGFARFKSDNQAAIESLRAGRGENLILVDLQQAQLQTQDMVKAAQAYIAGADNKAKRIALVASSALARMQTKRLAVRPGVIQFERTEDARHWLLSSGTPSTGIGVSR